MNAKTANHIEFSCAVLGVELERGFYGFYRPGSTTCTLSYDSLEHDKELLHLDKLGATRLMKSLQAMIDLMGWEEC